MHIKIFSYLSIVSLLYIRLYSFILQSIFYDKYYHEISNSIYQNYKFLYILRTLCTFTCLSTSLSTYISICYLLNYKYPIILLPVAWNLNFLSVICYNTYLINSNFGLSMDFTLLDNKIMKYFSHGPHLLYLIPHIKDNYNPNLFNTNTILMSYFVAFLWFIFIFFPWYYLTNDYLYTIYSCNYTVSKKIITTINISFIAIIGNYCGSLIKE